VPGIEGETVVARKPESKPKSKPKSQPKSTASRSRRPGKAAPASAPANGGFRAKIRMYRQGLGDCFLITLPRSTANGEPFRVMIDCGVILGTPDATTRMTNVVRDIVKETKGHIDLLLATHLHWDHLSGFAQAEAELKNLKVDQVWMPWTEDPEDPNGRKLRAEQDNALSSLRMSMARMNLAGASEAASEVAGLLEFFGMGASTADALEIVRKLAPVHYCRPGEKLDPADAGVRLYVMGPPQDEKFLKKFNPSKANPETFGFALDAFPATPPSVGSKTDSPFGTVFAIPMQAARAMEFFQQRYWTGTGEDEWRNIAGASFADASALALQLDRVTNNTSLAIAIELADGDVLLFPADAQVGNWLSWETLKWDVAGGEVKGHDLLRRAIFLKVGHHGSHNATLREAGLDLMGKLQVAMVPVDAKMAQVKGWDHMPLGELMEALKARAKTVVRADEPPPPGVAADAEGLFYEVVL
jgi:hypothetical protein